MKNICYAIKTNKGYLREKFGCSTCGTSKFTTTDNMDSCIKYGDKKQMERLCEDIKRKLGMLEPRVIKIKYVECEEEYK